MPKISLPLSIIIVIKVLLTDEEMYYLCCRDCKSTLFYTQPVKKSSLHYKTSLVYKIIHLCTVVINPPGFLLLYYLFPMIYIIVMIINSSIQDNTWSLLDKTCLYKMHVHCPKSHL